MLVGCRVYAWLRVCIGISVLVLKRGLVTRMAPKKHVVAGKAEIHRHKRFQLPVRGSGLNVTQVQDPFIVVQYRVESNYFQLELDLRQAKFLRTDRDGSSTPPVRVSSSAASTPPAVQPEIHCAVHRHNRFQLPARGSWLHVTQVHEPFIVVQYKVESHYFRLEIDLSQARFLRTDRDDSSTPGMRITWGSASTPPAVQPATRGRSRTPRANGRS